MDNSNPNSIPSWIKEHHGKWEQLDDCYEELDDEDDIRKYLIQNYSI
jgi:hypothetical protein